MTNLFGIKYWSGWFHLGVKILSKLDHQNYPQNPCGWCQETMRDIAIIWSLQAREALSAKKLKNVAYRVIDSVCETVNLRHSPTYATQIQTACNELLDDHFDSAIVCSCESLWRQLRPPSGPLHQYIEADRRTLGQLWGLYANPP